MTDRISAEITSVARPWNVNDLAEHWGCSQTFVYSRINSGELMSFRLGGKLIRISRQAVDDYEQRMEAPALRAVDTSIADRKANICTASRLLRFRHA